MSWKNVIIAGVILLCSCTRHETEVSRGENVIYKTPNNYPVYDATEIAEATKSPVPVVQPHIVKTPLGAPITTTQKERKAVSQGVEFRGNNFFHNPRALDKAVTETIRVRPSENGNAELSLINASIPAATKAVIGDLLGRSFVIDEGVEGRVTIQTTGEVPKSIVLDLYKAAIEAQGLGIIVNGTTVRVTRENVGSAQLFSVSGRPKTGDAIVVAPLKYISALQMLEVLQPIVKEGLSASVVGNRNLLMLSGDARQIDMAVDTLNIFDIDIMKGRTIFIEPLRVANSTEVVSELQKIFDAEESGELADVIQFVPNSRLKAVLIISKQSKYADEARTWIRKLDQAAAEVTRYPYTYFLQNRSARDLEPLLAKLFSPSASGSNASDENSDNTEIHSLFGSATIVADDVKNALIVFGLKSEHEGIQDLLAQLDGSPKQVLIEATIAEVTLNDEIQLGVRWYFERGALNTTFSNLATGIISRTAPGLSAIVEGNRTQAALNALASVTDVNVISSPNVMVQDNREAVLQIGDQVPVATKQESADSETGSVSTQIEYRDTGVILKVKPQIGRGNRVILDIEQEVSDVVLTTSSGIDSPTIRRRQIQTNVVVDNGATLLLGGIIQQKNNKVDVRLPGVGDIPVAGAPFRNRENTAASTELVILIRPVVVSDGSDAQLVTDYWRDHMPRTNRILLNGVAPPIRDGLPVILQ